MAETETNVVVTRKLTKVFRDFWLREKVTAVNSLDMDVRPKEVFGLLGPNGSGKTTTLKMILGLLFPTSGRIAIFGKRPTDVSIKAKIGFLPEESYLYPFLDARETLDYYGKLFQIPRKQRLTRIDMLLDMVGLSSVAYRRIGEYSKGMQRRIGLAQALINDPDLLILDEPTSGMDPIGTRQFKDLIQNLAQRGKTVILSSHLLADVEDVCDRVCILYGGQERAVGDIKELLAQHKLTQITTDSLDEETLRKIDELLATSGKGIQQVTTPRDKLEAYFLRIVEEAQSQRVRTGGAISGGEVAEFLRSQEPAEGEAVIEQLVSATKQQEQKHIEHIEQVESESDKESAEVLEGLVSPAKPEREVEQSEPAEAEKPTPQQAPKADQSIIDDLLNKGNQDEEEK